MTRLALALALPLLVGASTPQMPDVNEMGRTLATLNDWRVIVYVLIFLLFLQTLERLWAGFRATKTADKFAEGATTLAKSMDTLAGSHAVSSIATQGELSRLALEIRDLATIVRGKP